jgi:hypothetical protein
MEAIEFAEKPKVFAAGKYMPFAGIVELLGTIDGTLTEPEKVAACVLLKVKATVFAPPVVNTKLPEVSAVWISDVVVVFPADITLIISP